MILPDFAIFSHFAILKCSWIACLAQFQWKENFLLTNSSQSKRHLAENTSKPVQKFKKIRYIFKESSNKSFKISRRNKSRQNFQFEISHWKLHCYPHSWHYFHRTSDPSSHHRGDETWGFAFSRSPRAIIIYTANYRHGKLRSNHGKASFRDCFSTFFPPARLMEQRRKMRQLDARDFKITFLEPFEGSERAKSCYTFVCFLIYKINLRCSCELWTLCSEQCECKTFLLFFFLETLSLRTLDKRGREEVLERASNTNKRIGGEDFLFCMNYSLFLSRRRRQRRWKREGDCSFAQSSEWTN